MPETLADATMVQAAGTMRLAAHLRARGVDPDPILAAAGIDPEIVTRAEDLVSLRRHCLALRLAADRLGDPTLGLSLAAPGIVPRDYGLLAFLLDVSRDLRSGLSTMAQLYSAAITAADVRLELLADHARVITRYRVDVPGLELMRQESLAGMYLHARRISGDDWAPLAVSIAQQPADLAPFHELFGVEVQAGADQDELLIPGHALDRPNPGHDPGMLVHLLEAAETHVRRRREAGGATDELLRLVGTVVDLGTGVVRHGQDTDRLTPRERALLRYFVRRANEVVTHEEIEREVWGIDEATITHAPAVAIRRLRRKIEPDERNPVNLITEFGSGWRLRVFEG